MAQVLAQQSSALEAVEAARARVQAREPEPARAQDEPLEREPARQQDRRQDLRVRRPERERIGRRRRQDRRARRPERDRRRQDLRPERDQALAFDSARIHQWW